MKGWRRTGKEEKVGIMVKGCTQRTSSLPGAGRSHLRPVAGAASYRITHRHPGLRSLASRSRLYCAFAPFASSSSTTSCGLTVIWTTFGCSLLNLESSRVVSVKVYNHSNHSLVTKTYQKQATYHPTTSRTKLDG